MCDKANTPFMQSSYQLFLKVREVLQWNAHASLYFLRQARIMQLPLQQGWFRWNLRVMWCIQLQEDIHNPSGRVGGVRVREWVDYFVKKTMPLVWGSFLRTSHDCFTSRSLSLEYTWWGVWWSAPSGTTAASTTEASAIGNSSYNFTYTTSITSTN